MKFCEKVFKILNVNFETKIISAHRTPVRMYDYAKKAEKNKISVIIAGAGGSAHLPGMIASLTVIPVIGVPIYCFPIIELKPIPKIVKARPVATWLDIKIKTK